MNERVLLVTVSDDRFGRKEGAYKQTQIKIGNIIQANPDFGLEVFQWDWLKLQQSKFYHDNTKILSNIDPAINGRVYKPFVIIEGLMSVDFGDYVIYNDCSPELWNYQPELLNHQNENKFSIPGKYRIEKLAQLVRMNDDILTPFVKWDTKKTLTNGLGIHTHDNFTLNRCINRMGLQKHQHDYQHASGFIAIRKTLETMEFMREWLYWNLMPECAAMGPKDGDFSYWEAEESFKMGHRHDQSISGLLINKRGGHLIDMPPYEGMNPYNFLQYCRTDCEHYFISSINTMPPGPEVIKKGSTVKNQNGTELTVFEIWPEDGVELYIVGQHRQSAYKTTANNLTLIKQ